MTAPRDRAQGSQRMDANNHVAAGDSSTAVTEPGVSAPSVSTPGGTSHGAPFSSAAMAACAAGSGRRTLEASYAACRSVARRSASSFYFSFFLLPKSQRDAMCALYAFLRRTDDLGDSAEPVEVRRAALAEWRRALDDALAGRFADPLLPALVDSVRRFRIPSRTLEDAVSGVEMDLWRTRYETLAEAESYCRHVASAVGLACIHIWGFRDPGAIEPAVRCGLAFQWTNILRDLKEDAARGRLYLPLEDLARWGLAPDDLARGVSDGRVRELMRLEIGRAEAWYDQAAPLAGFLLPRGRRIFRAMVATYRSLLDEIKRRGGDVWSAPVRLPTWRKLHVVARSFVADV